MSLTLRTFAGQAMGGDAWQRLSAHVAEGRSGVRAGVPVVHPGEMLHVELARLWRHKQETDNRDINSQKHRIQQKSTEISLN